jgi:hypothetical protein
MMLHTRRRALALLLAAGAVLRPPSLRRALAAKQKCFESKAFGLWKAQATDSQAGARISEVKFATPCDLRVELQVAASFDGKIVVYGDPDEAPLPRKFLKKPENRLLVRDEDGKVAVDEPLCGNCTDIFDNKVSIVLPLATAPFFRDAKSCEIAIKLVDKDECNFKVDCESLRAGLAWATERKEALAALAADQKCEPPGGCFITTACCETLGLPDDCFELRTLRRYRDEVLAMRPGGKGEIAIYYALAPQILARLPHAERAAILRSIYARYILPASLAAGLGLNTLAHRLYMQMLNELAGAANIQSPELSERLRDQRESRWPGVSSRPPA